MAKKKTKRRGGRKPGTWDLVQPADIRTYRDKHRISRARLAEILGVSTTSIMNWESGAGVALRPMQARLRELVTSAPPVPLRALAQPTPMYGSAPHRSNGAGSSLEAVGRIVAAYVAGAEVRATDLPGLVQRVRQALE